MRAMIYDAYGDNSVLRLADVPKPKVAPGTVLIKSVAASVNPVDWKMMAGYLDGIMYVQFPVIPGWDVAGVIEAVGIDAPEYAVGDEVFSYARKDFVHGGTFAEYVVVPAPSVARKPASLSFEEAAAIPLTGMTAQRALDRLELVEGDTLLIHGGAGGVGLFGVQIARARGARVIATASESNHDFLRSLGAEPVTYGEGVVERIRMVAPDGVDAVADFFGGVVDVTLGVLKQRGRHVSIADHSVEEHGGAHVWVRPDGAKLAELAAMADAGTLRVEVAETFPLERAGAAFDLSRSGHTRGKIVVRVSG